MVSPSQSCAVRVIDARTSEDLVAALDAFAELGLPHERLKAAIDAEYQRRASLFLADLFDPPGGS